MSYLSLIVLWAVTGAFSSIHFMPMRLLIEMQCEVIIGQLVQSLGKDHVVYIYTLGLYSYVAGPLSLNTIEFLIN